LGQAFEGAYSEDVAVLSNNDKTVSVVSLKDQEALDEISYPDCVNRAVLSPDGRLLVAVSDDPFLYVHERAERSPAVGNAYRSADRLRYEWRSLRKIHLQSQKVEDRSDNRGSFAACFSSSGKYLAVGTQYGSISIFDVADVADLDMDPLVTTFTSSRPNAEHGAVRDMAFAPGPIDLLAWTEDRGRVGVADIRNGFASRQILELDKHEDFEHLTVTDRSSIDPRLIENHNHTSSSGRSDALSSNFANTLELSPDGRHRRLYDLREPLDRFTPLTSDETIVLEALQSQRRRREQQRLASTAQAGSGGSVGNPRPTWGERTARLLRASESNQNRERSVSVSRAVSDILSNIRDQRSAHDRLRTAAAAHREESAGERRRIIPTTASTTTAAAPVAASSSSSSPSTQRPPANAAPTAATSELSERERRVLITRLLGQYPLPPPGGNGAAGTGLDSAEVLYSPTSLDPASLASIFALFDGPDGSSLAPLPPPRSQDRPSRVVIIGGGDEDDADNGDGDAAANANARRRRDRAQHLMREWDDHPSRRPLGTYFSRERADPKDTAGLSWSEDGQVLFVGAEDGIYEFHVDQFGRMLFPSVTFR